MVSFNNIVVYMDGTQSRFSLIQLFIQSLDGVYIKNTMVNKTIKVLLIKLII